MIKVRINSSINPLFSIVHATYIITERLRLHYISQREQKHLIKDQSGQLKRKFGCISGKSTTLQTTETTFAAQNEKSKIAWAKEPQMCPHHKEILHFTYGKLSKTAQF